MRSFWKETLINSALVFAALFIGGAVNMLLVNLGGQLIAAPKGADVTTMEGLKASIHLFKPINFLFPFLAHALGVLISSFLATKFLKRNQIAMVVGIVLLNFIGGLMMVIDLPGAPLWFDLTDLILAYAPMGFLGWVLAGRKNGKFEKGPNVRMK
jgi:hypothetical protein